MAAALMCKQPSMSYKPMCRQQALIQQQYNQFEQDRAMNAYSHKVITLKNVTLTVMGPVMVR